MRWRGAAEADTGPFCVWRTVKGSLCRSALCYQHAADGGSCQEPDLSMKANIAGHKDVLQAGDTLLQKGGGGLKFTHHNRQN